VDPIINPEELAAIIGAFGLLILLGLVVVIVVAHFIGKAAARKERSYGSFFALSILLSPLITALVVAALPFSSQDPNKPKHRESKS